MVATYTIFGQKVGSHILAMIVLGGTFGGSFLATRGDPKKQDNTPPINATSKDEENFIQEFIKNAEAEEKKEKAKH